VVSWVLGDFCAEERKTLEEIFERGIGALEELLRGTLSSAQRKFH
jgi:peptidyl-tRNA hydrolase